MSNDAISVAIPAPQTTQEELNTWYALQQKLDEIKTQERALRKKIFAAFFQAPKEGTNTASLTDGWVLKGGHVINRKVDVALLTTHVADLREHNVPTDELVKYKPELVLPEYRKLNDEQRNLFDRVLDIKIGSPSLEIVLPKR